MLLPERHWTGVDGARRADGRRQAKELGESATQDVIEARAETNHMIPEGPAAIVFDLTIGLHRGLRREKVWTGAEIVRSSG